MELFVLDRNFIAQKIVDTYESLIWTDKYCECGDFELYMPMDPSLMRYFKRKNYLIQRDSDHGMIIEKIKINFDAESGTHLIVSGRSFESLLLRRFVWSQVRLRTTLDAAVKKILEDSIINPKDKDRQISNFIYEETDDPYIKDISIDKTFSGDTVYDAIVEICTPYDIGFKVRFENEQFIFSLYYGKDRTYDQMENPYVIFSSNFENLLNSNYEESDQNEKNVVLVAGENEHLGEGRASIVIGEGRGIDRRELYVDARDIQSERYDDDGNEVILSEEEYKAALRSRGEDKLQEYKLISEFSGEAEVTKMFRYGEHFFIGDLVQIEDDFGNFRKARISEIIFSQNESGYVVYPTFEVLDTEEVNAK